MKTKLVLLTAVLAVTACQKKGTFVVLDFTSGPATSVHTIQCDLGLGGKTATATFTSKGDGFVFPTSGSLQIESGTGTLTVSCEARGADGGAVGSVAGSIEVARDRSVTLALPFTSMSDFGTDAGSGAFVIAPAIHDYGVVVTGSSSPAFSYTVTNGTGEASTALVVMLDGADAIDFTVDGSGCQGKTLAPGATCTVTAAFAPEASTALAPKMAALHVGTVTATLSGTAAAQGALLFSETMHDLGGALVGTAGPDTTFTLSNTGGVPTSLITISLSGNDAAQFAIVADGCTGHTLASGATCTVKAHLAPTARGPLTATLSASADTGGTTIVFLSGAGQIGATLTIVQSTTMTTPAALGTVDVGSTATTPYSFTVRNDGDFASGDLSIGKLATNTGTQASELVLGSGTTCTATTQLAPLATCVVELALTPTTFGEKDFTVTVSATPGGDATTYVRGTGRDYVTVTVASDGTGSGTISDNAAPPDFACTGNAGTCTKTFVRDTAAPMLKLTATPAGASTFSAWTVAGGPPTCTEGTMTATCTLLFDQTITGSPTTAAAQAAPHTYTATFGG
ncbi:MAG: choice-of-anchor D domain-containing protein [Polyangia bacterium]